ncbi:hypothetical protein FKM82_024591, partial [Ascaphus truei]
GDLLLRGGRCRQGWAQIPPPLRVTFQLCNEISIHRQFQDRLTHRTSDTCCSAHYSHVLAPGPAYTKLRPPIRSMASVWETAQDFYVWALENGDSRTDPWLLVYSPVPVALIFALYLLVVALGPRLMDGREPFTLRSVLFLYNLALVALSAYMFYEVRPRSAPV